MASSLSPEQVRDARRYFRHLLVPEHGFIRITIAYSIVVSLLTLAVPIAVQTLVNTVVNIASVGAVVTLSLLLFFTLALSGLFSALRTEIMERYERHVYARLTAEISARAVLAESWYFEGRRNSDITNRYFDIMTFQKNVPPLVIDGFALLLQMLVGFTLVSFYHPVFLAFSLVVISTTAMVWFFWGYHAVRTGLILSKAKYATAKWLGTLSTAHGFFKSERHIDYARQQTDQQTADYIKAHKNHFKYTFSQTICLLAVYAIASSALLGMGGILVIRGELSIGQLVAAELILAAIFFALSQSSTYLKLYYELCGAADKLYQVLTIPMETDQQGLRFVSSTHYPLVFSDVEITTSLDKYTLNVNLPSATKSFLVCADLDLQRQLINALRGESRANEGYIHLADQDLGDYDRHVLRQSVVVIDRALIVECSIVQYMKLNAPEATIADIQHVLTKVGLLQAVERLPDGLETILSPLGAPLQHQQFVLLKLASALLLNPRVLVLTQYVDNIPRNERLAMLRELAALPMHVLYFTHQPDLPVFDYCWQVDGTGCVYYDTVSKAVEVKL